MTRRHLPCPPQSAGSLSSPLLSSLAPDPTPTPGRPAATSVVSISCEFTHPPNAFVSAILLDLGDRFSFPVATSSVPSAKLLAPHSTLGPLPRLLPRALRACLPCGSPRPASGADADLSYVVPWLGPDPAPHPGLGELFTFCRNKLLLLPSPTPGAWTEPAGPTW